MPESELPVDLLLWIAATLPLAAILLLLIGLRWKAASAAPVGYFLAVVIAIVLFQTSLSVIGLQTVKGVWDALFIAYVIVPALLLYQITKEAGAFETIRRGIESFTPNDLLHVLAFGWVLATFLQGITGFGAPLAVAAPLLVALGVKPLWAVVIPVVGHAWAKTFGTLGVAWEGLTLVTDMEDPALTAIVTATMLGAANLLAGLVIAWAYGRGRGIREGLPAIVIIAAIHGVGQAVLAPLVPNLANVIPGAVAVVAVLVLARTLYARPSGVTDSPIFEAGAQGGETGARTGGSAEQGGSSRDDRTEATSRTADAGRGGGEGKMPLWLAFSPYLTLIVLILVVQLVPPLHDALSALQIGLAFPELETGYGVVTESTEAYSAFAPLTHPGTFLLVSSALAFAVFRMRGSIRPGRIDDTLVETVRTSIPSVFAFLALIPLALVLEGSGMVTELALGIAAVATGPVYAFLAPFIGLLGGFLTGSNLSSNILFGPLQERAADALDIRAAVVLAAQTAGAAIGGTIAISTVLVGLGAVGESGRAGEVIRRTLPWAVLVLVTIGAISVLGAVLLDPGGSDTAMRWEGG